MIYVDDILFASVPASTKSSQVSILLHTANLEIGASNTSANTAFPQIEAALSTMFFGTLLNIAWTNLLPRWLKNVSRSEVLSSWSDILSGFAKDALIVLAFPSLIVSFLHACHLPDAHP